jgi:hypothetical protein
VGPGGLGWLGWVGLDWIPSADQLWTLQVSITCTEAETFTTHFGIFATE